MDAVLTFLNSLHFSPIVFLAQMGLFVLFHLLMQQIIYNPIMRARDEREGRIEGRLAKAEAAAVNASKLKQKYDEEIRAQRALLAQELKEAIHKAEQDASARMQQARDEAGKLADEFYRKLDQEEEQIRTSMDKKADELALAVARQVIKTSLPADAQGRVLAQLEG